MIVNDLTATDSGSDLKETNFGNSFFNKEEKNVGFKVLKDPLSSVFVIIFLFLF